MTHIVVTGGSGKLGRAVVADLVDNGYQVTNLDRRPPADQRSAFVLVDFTDYGQVLAALLGVDDKYDTVERGASGRHPGAGPDDERRHLRQQHHQHPPCFRRRPGSRNQDRGVGVQRDGAWAAIRSG